MIDTLIFTALLIAAFAVGIGFGAYLQRQVFLGRDIRILPRREKSVVVTDEPSDFYASPYHGHEL